MIYNPDSLNLQVITYGETEAHCICPFHHDTKPSASFNMKSGLFYCFSCGTAHNVQSLAFALNGIVEKIEKYYNDKRSYSTEKSWLKLLHNPLAHDNEYLSKRNVTNDLVNIFQIRCNSHGVIFPITDTNKNVKVVQIRQYKRYLKYLTFGEKLPVWPLYVEPVESDYHHVMVVEGVFGVINLYRLGVNAFATMGAMMKSGIKDYIHHTHVFGFFDHDFAGYVAGARLLKFIPRAEIIVPGGEIDNFSYVDLTKMLYTREHTRYLPQLAELSGDKDKFWQYVPKVS